MIFSPVVEPDLQPGERVCHRRNPHLKGIVQTFPQDGWVWVLWDDNEEAEWQLASNIVPIGRKEKAA